MPLHVQVIRNNKPVELRWGWFHLEAIHLALEAEGKTLNDYGYRLKETHKFIDEEDGEEFTLYPGDRIESWR